MKKILLSLCCLLWAATASFSQQASDIEGYPARLWGIPWPTVPGTSEYADFDFDQVVATYPGSAWLMQGNRYFYGVGGVAQDFGKAFECFQKAAEYYPTSNTEEAWNTTEATTETVPEMPEDAETDVATESEPDPAIDGGEWTTADTAATGTEKENFGNDFTLANGKTIWLAPTNYLNYALALSYAFGLGTAPDADKAAQWGMKGEPDAWLIAGIARYRSGAYDEAWQMFEAAAAESDFGRIWLAECKLRGHGTEQKAKEALRELEALPANAENAQDADMLAAVYLRLSECYGQGLGTRRDTEKAASYLQKAGNMISISPSGNFRKAAQ